MGLTFMSLCASCDLLLKSCLFSKEKERVWSWVGGQVGEILEDLRGNCDQNILYENIFFNKREEMIACRDNEK